MTTAINTTTNQLIKTLGEVGMDRDALIELLMQDGPCACIPICLTGAEVAILYEKRTALSSATKGSR